MYKKILVSLDGSAASSKALQHATQLAEIMHAEITLFHVMYIPPQAQLYSGKIKGAFNKMRERLDDDAKSIFEQAKRELDIKQVVFKEKSVWGEPANEIIQEGQQGGYDLIIIGNRGLGEVKGWLLGSVSQRVLHHSQCSVLLVK